MTIWPLSTKPYDVQLEALRLSHGKECFGYWMEQGLGKTGVCFADFITHFYMEMCEVLVMVAPFYLMSEWEGEAAKQGVKFPIFTWPQEIPYGQKPPYAYIINIEAARAGRGLKFLDELLDRHRCMLGIDESTMIKNFKSVAFKSLMALGNKASMRRELSGLPMPHDVMDNYPQLRFLKQLSGVNPYAFRNRFAVMGGYMGKKVKGIKNEEELHKILDACSFRALKKDWAKSLPPKIYTQRRFEMSKRQREAYLEMEQDFVTMVDRSNPETAVFAEQVITAMLKLQQISRGFIMDGERVAQNLVDPMDNSAVNTLLASLDAIQGKTLIFTAYRHSTEQIYEVLRDRGSRGVRMMMGGLDKEEIKAAKAEFNEDPDVGHFVLQTAVGHRGHTLLGQEGPTTRCSSTIFYENTFNYEHRAQGEDRNHRWGQNADCVTYTDFVCSKMDEKYLAAFATRQDLVDTVLNAVRSIPR